jgi:ribonuclease D
LPEPWLRYAALDVEVLVALRDAIATDLADQGKWAWAEEEFAALVSFTGPPPRVDPWRRTSGIHRIRRRRSIAVLRELWYVRDRIAQRRDVSPGRVLPDAGLVELAADPPADVAAFAVRRALRPIARHPRVWLEGIARATALPEDGLPPLTLPGSGPPPPRIWAERDPVAAARYAGGESHLARSAPPGPVGPAGRADRGGLRRRPRGRSGTAVAGGDPRSPVGRRGQPALLTRRLVDGGSG